MSPVKRWVLRDSGETRYATAGDWVLSGNGPYLWYAGGESPVKFRILTVVESFDMKDLEESDG